MGKTFSRRRDVPANGAEAPATEQKAAEEPAPVSQQVVETPAPVVEEPAAAVAEPVVEAAPAEPVVESVPEPVVEPVAAEPAVKAEPEPEAPAASALLVDLTPEPAVETPQEAPAAPEPEPEPLVSVSEPPAPEPVAEPEPEPEPVAEPEPEAVPEVDDPIEESLPEPEPLFTSDPLVELGVPDLTPQLLDTSPSPASDHAHSPEPAYPDVPTDLPGEEECLDSMEAAVNSIPVLEDPKESPEMSLEQESTGVAGNVEQLLCDVNTEAGDSGLLKHLDLTGNDLVNDLLANDTTIPDDIPIADGSPSTELM